MSITQTAITADLSASALTATVTSGSGFPSVGTIASPPYLVRIDKEFMLCNAQPAAGTISLLQRGYAGTAAAPHDILSKIEVSASPSDFADPSPGNVVTLTPAAPSQQTIGEDITYTSAQIAGWGNQPQIFAITKATAAAIVLVAPSKAQDGLTLEFTNLTDAIHVLTATALFASGGSASPYTTATWANAKAGGGITVQAMNGLWNVINSLNVTLT